MGSRRTSFIHMKMAVEDYRMITFYSGKCMKKERDDINKELRRVIEIT